MLAGVEKKGQKLATVGMMGAAQAVYKAAGSKEFVGAADPRVDGKAEGW